MAAAKFTVCCQSIYVCQLANISPRHQHLWCYFFVSGSPATLFDSTNPDWAPSLKLGYQEDGGGSCSTRSSTRSARQLQVEQVSARHSRAVSRSRKRTIVEVDAEPEPEIPELDISETTELEIETPGCGTQTDLTMANIDEMRHRDEILQEQIDSLKDSNEQLKKHLGIMSLMSRTLCMYYACSIIYVVLLGNLAQ